MVLGLSSRHGDLVCICSVVIEDDYRSCLKERARSCSQTCSMGIVSVRHRSNGHVPCRSRNVRTWERSISTQCVDCSRLFNHFVHLPYSVWIVPVLRAKRSPDGSLPTFREAPRKTIGFIGVFLLIWTGLPSSLTRFVLI